MDAETRRQILERVSSGEISAAEAARLLEGDQEKQPAAESESVEALKAEEQAAAQPAQGNGAQHDVQSVAEAPSGPASGKKPSWLRIRVADASSGQPKVSVNIPLRMVRLGLRIGSRFAPELEKMDLNEFNTLLDDAETGVLVDVQDHEDGEHVKIYLE